MWSDACIHQEWSYKSEETINAGWWGEPTDQLISYVQYMEEKKRIVDKHGAWKTANL